MIIEIESRRGSLLALTLWATVNGDSTFLAALERCLTSGGKVALQDRDGNPLETFQRPEGGGK